MEPLSRIRHKPPAARPAGSHGHRSLSLISTLRTLTLPRSPFSDQQPARYGAVPDGFVLAHYLNLPAGQITGYRSSRLASWQCQYNIC